MEQALAFLQDLFPDVLIYGLTAIVLLIGIVKCCAPVLRNAGALRRAAETLEEGAKMKLARPVWRETKFLGRGLQTDWRTFLQNVDLTQSHGVPCDVADYIHEESVIDVAGRSGLAEIVPGACTSLGILGTFIGLSMGLNGLDVLEISSLTQLTSGIALAFNTSIVGIIASLCFNLLQKIANGRARAAIQVFTLAFYKYGIPQPADASTRLLAYEQEQADAMGAFSHELAERMAGEMHDAIQDAMTPVTQSMQRFMEVATREQIQGLDLVVNRFVERMNAALHGHLEQLGDAIAETARGQRQTMEELRASADGVLRATAAVSELHKMSAQIIEQFNGFVGEMRAAFERVTGVQQEAGDLLTEISDASLEQARYLSALQEYQAKLQGSFQEYTIWTDKFVGGLEERTEAQNEQLENVAREMRESAALLSGSYKSFVESIEIGLSNALGLFDENMQTLTRQLHGTLSEINRTIERLDRTLSRSGDREVG